MAVLHIAIERRMLALFESFSLGANHETCSTVSDISDGRFFHPERDDRHCRANLFEMCDRC